MLARMPMADMFRPSSADNVMSAVTSYVPAKFNWWIFGTGQIMLVLAIVFIFNRRVNPSVKGD